MFDVGFWELAVIMVVALLVVGPERLPKLARTVGLWVGKGRRFVQTVKADVDRELAADELKKTLAKQAEIPELYDIIEETKQTLKETSTLSSEQPDEKQELTDKSHDGAG
jgi:sec-independent protein translocase protein TatB